MRILTPQNKIAKCNSPGCKKKADILAIIPGLEGEEYACKENVDHNIHVCDDVKLDMVFELVGIRE